MFAKDGNYHSLLSDVEAREVFAAMQRIAQLIFMALAPPRAIPGPIGPPRVWTPNYQHAIPDPAWNQTTGGLLLAAYSPSSCLLSSPWGMWRPRYELAGSSQEHEASSIDRSWLLSQIKSEEQYVESGPGTFGGKMLAVSLIKGSGIQADIMPPKAELLPHEQFMPPNVARTAWNWLAHGL